MASSPTSPTIVPADATAAAANIDASCQNLLNHRQKSLMVLYYPAGARMLEDDLADVHDAFRDAGITVEEKLPFLDVLLDLPPIFSPGIMRLSPGLDSPRLRL